MNVKMEDEMNVGSENNQRIEQQYPVCQSMIIQEKPKINYWMISTLVLLFMLFISGGLYFINSRVKQNVDKTSTKINQNRIIPSKTLTPSEKTLTPVKFINTIVILKEGGLALINPDGTGLRQIYTPESNNFANGVVWSPDGKKLAFSLGANMFSNGGDLSIMIFDLENNDVETLVPYADFHSPPSWSPDSKKIVYNSNGILKVVDIETKSSVDITTDAYSLPTGDLQEKIVYYNPTSVVWSVKNQIFYLQKVASTERRLTIISPDGKNKATLIPDKNIGTYGGIAISKDGTKIAYVENEKGIWLINSDGSNRRQLTKESIPDSNLQWSPDGKRLIATGGLGGIYLVFADTGRIVSLTSGSIGNWSPNGKQIVFTAQKPNVLKGGEIKTYNIDMGVEEKLSDSFSSIWETVWSPL